VWCKQNVWSQKCTYTPEVGSVEYNHGGAWMYTRSALTGAWAPSWNMAGEAARGPDGLLRAAYRFSDGVRLISTFSLATHFLIQI
jgi:hypothetical protein